MQLEVKAVLACLALLAKDKRIRMLDHQFARFIAQYCDDGWVVLASAIASHQSGQGHVCVDLENINRQPLFGLSHHEAHYLDDLLLSQTMNWPALLIKALAASTVEGDNAPLKMAQHNLYLQRYWFDEQQINQFLGARGAEHKPIEIAPLLTSLFNPDLRFIYSKLSDLRQMKMPLSTFCRDFFHVRNDLPAAEQESLAQALATVDSLDALAEFCTTINPLHTLDWQKVAVAIAASNKFSIISGGPGTGKTTTVIKLLALLVQIHQAELAQDSSALTPALCIELVAPTGKAAARLSESISGALDKLHLAPEFKALIPTSASTIHRLLGVIPNSNKFRHHRENRLHVDVLIVDEASMIDISLMAKLFGAIAPHTKVVLLGDKDQLSSVEAGSVFADICGDLSRGANYDEATLDWLSRQSGFSPSLLAPAESSTRTVVSNGLSLLHKSYRFGQFSGIGALARAVNQGDVVALKSVWQQGYQDIGLHHQNDNSRPQIVQMSVNGYQGYLELAKKVSTTTDVLAVLAQFNEFQLLTPLRGGKFGLDELNHAIETSLNRYRFIDISEGVWYIGRPVMISSNDHSQQLYNGDIGILLPDIEQRDGAARVYFIMADGQLKSFLPSRLPAHETVYAMTIHKSQGSEFDHVVISMPSQWSALLTKELVYTGITRAKKTVDVFSSAQVLQQAMLTKTVRNSGLARALQLGY